MFTLRTKGIILFNCQKRNLTNLNWFVFRGLVPLHNACSYGHYEVTELLVKHGASVNVADLWKFTPLHEAAAKGKCEIVRLLLRHGADPNKKNRDGSTPLDLVREGDQDVADLLRGNSALLDAAKKGNLTRVQRLVTQDNINCRDAQGRNSTPLHLAGENNSWKRIFFLQDTKFYEKILKITFLNQINFSSWL